MQFKKSAILFLPLLAVIFVGGCIGQTKIVGSGLNVRVSADPSSILDSESTSIFVDVENTDTTDMIKVFIDVFDTGKLEITDVARPPQGKLRPAPPRNCTSSFECWDEEYGGSGVCLGSGDKLVKNGEVGTCVASSRSQGVGGECDKQSHCSYGLVCDIDRKLGRKTCQKPATDNFVFKACSGGTPVYSCAEKKPFYCDPYGTSFEQCTGADEIANEAYEAPKKNDDCGCPEDKNICRGDGSCGILSQCSATIYGLHPGEIRTLRCDLRVARPEKLISQVTSNSIEARIRFTKRLSSSLVVPFLSLDEYRRRQITGDLPAASQGYSFQDKNVKVDMSFSKAPPFIAGERVLVWIDIQNIGEGRVYTIRPGQFFIGQIGDALKCDLRNTLRSDVGDFPRVTCELNVPENTTFESYTLFPTLYYDNEIRKTLNVGIMKRK